MHNCRTTREQITELLLTGVETGPGETIECNDCRAEFESLKETLRLTRRAIEAAAPAKESWSTYSLTLKQKLAAATATVALDTPKKPSIKRENWLLLSTGGSVAPAFSQFQPPRIEPTDPSRVR